MHLVNEFIQPEGRQHMIQSLNRAEGRGQFANGQGSDPVGGDRVDNGQQAGSRQQRGGGTPSQQPQQTQNNNSNNQQQTAPRQQTRQAPQQQTQNNNQQADDGPVEALLNGDGIDLG
jgi:hypothetical protein